MVKRSLLAVAGIVLVVATATVSLPLAPAEAQMDHGDHGRMGGMAMPMKPQKAPLTLEKLHSGHLPLLSTAIDRAIKAVEQGDKKTALAELDMAKKMIAEINQAMGKLMEPTFANERCPIMGSPINPERVTKDLIRNHEGQIVAFCCQGCPAQWDKLTNAQKAVRLSAAQPAAERVWTCPMHPQVKQAEPGLCPICNMRLTARAGKHTERTR